MKARRHILAWLGLVLPTLAVGALALGLLNREQARLNELARQSALAQAQTVADNLDLIMAEIKDGVMLGLAAASGEGDLTGRLMSLVMFNPFVEAFLVYDPNPRDKNGSLDDRAHFYGSEAPDWAVQLFKNNRSQWFPAATLNKPQEEEQEASAQMAQLKAPIISGNYSNTKMIRQGIRELSFQNAQELNGLKQQEQQEAMQAHVEQELYPDLDLDSLKRADSVFQAQSVWVVRPDGQPGWLGWYQRSPDGRVIGVVLDPDAVLKQLLGAFSQGGNQGYRLYAPNGDLAYAFSSSPTITVNDTDIMSVGAELPDWRLGIESDSIIDRPFFLLIGSLLVAVLCTATLAAGTMLLMQARRDAREAARKTTFVSNVSHELRTPLTTIRMYSEMLEEGRVADDDKRRRYLGTITAESQRLTRLVDNVLDFSRLEQGGKQYHREPVDAAAVVEAVLESQGPRLRAAEMAVSWQPPDEPVIVETDRDALGQVLLNLVDNALKYAASGKSLTLAVVRRPGCVQITVVDAGPGIPGKDAERVFTAFQRLDESLTTTQPGSGLGLSICRGLMRDLGGDVYLEPANPGCRFVISLTEKSSL